jgi:site-specific DNA-cytosine methylase
MNEADNMVYEQVAQPIAVDCFNQTINEKTSQTIGSSASDINHIGGVLQTMAIRRLTPKECERLQGFPDDWTKIPYRNKPADQCPDGPRYKACGNSMAVPVMRWIGTRIQMIENYLNP